MCEVISNYFINEVARAMTKCEESYKHTYVHMYIRPGKDPVWQHTFVSPSAFSRRAVVSYWRKYVHEVLINRLGGLSLPRKSVVRLTDRPDMTLDVYRGRKTTIQHKTPGKGPLSPPKLCCART